MTFSEARENALHDFDIRVKNIRDIISNPLWCNVEYKTYKEYIEKFNKIIYRIKRINEVEQENARPT